jgi:hypothetical protein
MLSQRASPYPRAPAPFGRLRSSLYSCYRPLPDGMPRTSHWSATHEHASSSSMMGIVSSHWPPLGAALKWSRWCLLLPHEMATGVGPLRLPSGPIFGTTGFARGPCHSRTTSPVPMAPIPQCHRCFTCHPIVLPWRRFSGKPHSSPTPQSGSILCRPSLGATAAPLVADRHRILADATTHLPWSSAPLFQFGLARFGPSEQWDLVFSYGIV